MRKVIVHIGIHKTGSSAIQNALYASRKDLMAQGILYPSVGPNLGRHFQVMFKELSQIQIARRRSTAYFKRSMRNELFDSFDAELRRSEWHTAILSAEILDEFDYRTASTFAEWVGNYADRIEVVAFVRHPVDWVRSVCQQRLRATTATLEKVYENLPRPSWRRKLMPWINVAGLENFHLVSYDEARRSGDLLGAFLNAGDLPLDPLLSTIRIGEVNTSMSLEAVLIMDSFNRQRLIEDPKSPESRALVESIRQVPGQRFRLPAGVAMSVRKRSRGEVRWLHERFGVDWFADVFSDTPIEEPRRPLRSTIDSMVKEMVEEADRHPMS